MTINIPVLREVTEANSELADALRQEFSLNNVLVLNVIASPGAGKTSLLERTIQHLNGELRISVIEGDPTTSIDAERIAAVGMPVVQINTGGGCHLEARQIRRAVEQLDVANADVVIIENVGNLMCPTEWDLGEDIKVVVASLPEGDDKPLKYPAAFMKSQAVVVNKIDLEPYIPAKAAVMRENALKINPDAAVLEVSCVTGQGIDQWLDWIREQLAKKRAASGAAGAPHA
jgi:hydrogenase nickel incorporation protein HypB